MSANNLKTAKAFKAIILANATLYPFSEPPSGLLPVLTKPLLEYQLNLLKKSGFDQCTIVCPESSSRSISDWVDQYLTTNFFSIRVCAAGKEGEQLSDCALLREVTTTKNSSKNRISLDCDFLLIPSDVFCSESLTKLLAYHHHKRATMTMMLVQPPPEDPSQKESKSKKASTSKKGPPSSSAPAQLIDPRLDEPDNPLYVGLDADNGRICVLREMDDEAGLKLHKDVLRQITSFTLYTHLRSPSVYIFSREALQLLHQYENIDNLDVLAQFLVGMQFVTENPRHNAQSAANQGFCVQTHLEQQSSLNSNGLTATSLESASSYRVGSSFHYKAGPKNDENSNNSSDDSHNNVVKASNEVAMLTGDYSDLDSIGDHSTYVTAAAQTFEQTKKNGNCGANDDFTFPIQKLTCYAFIPPPSALILRGDSIAAFTFLNKKLLQVIQQQEQLIGLQQRGNLNNAQQIAQLNVLQQSLALCEWNLEIPQNSLNETKERILREQRSAVPEADGVGAVGTPDGGVAQQPQEEQQQKGKGNPKKQNKKDNAKASQQQQIQLSGFFSDETLLGENVIIANSIIGRHCRIGKNAIIKDSILMDYSSVGDDAKVESTVIGTYGTIPAKSDAKHATVPPHSEFSASNSGF